MTFKPTKLDHERIQIIGKTMMIAKPGSTAACCVDADGGDGKWDGKGDWYEAQFKEKFPAVLITKRMDGPTPGAHTILLEAPPIRRRGSSDN